MRSVLVYVLMNHKKHGVGGGENIDPLSSARWFDGWRRPVAPATTPSPVSAPRTALASTGWRKCGLIDLSAAPRSGWEAYGIRASDIHPAFRGVKPNDPYRGGKLWRW
jgi:hypothetical protein